MQPPPQHPLPSPQRTNPTWRTTDRNSRRGAYLHMLYGVNASPLRTSLAYVSNLARPCVPARVRAGSSTHLFRTAGQIAILSTHLRSRMARPTGAELTAALLLCQSGVPAFMSSPGVAWLGLG